MTVKFPVKWRTLLKTVAKGGFLSSRLVRGPSTTLRMTAAQKVALEPLASALGVAAFLHNVIIVHP